MIKSFRNKSLANLWAGAATKIDARLHARILMRLDALHLATRPQSMDAQGFNFHALRGFRQLRYTVHVNGPWCITFAFEDGDAVDVDLEQYH